MLLATLTFALASNTFQPMGMMPQRTSCFSAYRSGGYGTAGGISPELHWTAAPLNTQSYALIMQDRDYRSGWPHWLVYNIPATTSSLPEGVVLSPPERPGTGAFGPRYWGPCPPRGQTHHYLFTMYALDVPTLPVWSPNTMLLLKAMNGHILSRAYLTGLFELP